MSIREFTYIFLCNLDYTIFVLGITYPILFLILATNFKFIKMESNNKIENKILTEDFKTSSNFYTSDVIFSHYFKKQISQNGFDYFNKNLDFIGRSAACNMDKLSILADKNGPELIKRDAYGELLDEISFHPSYAALMEIAVKSEMFRIKWEPTLNKKFQKELHVLGFSAGYLYAMSEMGQYCPLCMTDGVARLINKFCEEKDKLRLLPKIYTEKAKEFFTGAMFLTEKSGGSDVGRNIVTAEKIEGNKYKLYGEKWFCSNANADLIFALARTDESIKGTKGLSIFLVEKHLPEGTKNTIEMIRIKEKLGVRSMASAECFFQGAEATLVGEEFNGFKIMADMLNLSRLYNSVAAISAGRRGLIEAYNFLKYRITFGKRAIEHALIRRKLHELASLHVAGFYLTYRVIKALDASDNGNKNESKLVRFLTPMTKKWTAENGVYMVRESMELMGGNGYIEDCIMPKLMRDVMVLPIWEGAGNIMILDMLRAKFKSDGYAVMVNEISGALQSCEYEKDSVLDTFEKLQVKIDKLSEYSTNEMEVNAKIYFEKLTTLYQIALLIHATDRESIKWTKPTIRFLTNKFIGNEEDSFLYSVKEVEEMIGWEI